MPHKTFAIAVVLFAVGLTGCETAPDTAYERDSLEKRAAATVERFKAVDAGMNNRFFNSSRGYAVFPTVGKGAIGVGGAYGKGVLYEGNTIVGYCDLSQGSIGFALGGQAYSEIIFFEDALALQKFKAGTFEFAAQASAVAASADASADADYDHGVAVFTLAGKGLMYEASIGGQNFDYVPKAATSN